MKTTVEIDDELYRQAKVLAAQQGTTIKELMQRGLRLAMGIEEAPVRRHHVQFPLIKSKNPGRIVTAEEVRRAIEEADLEEALDDAYPNRR